MSPDDVCGVCSMKRDEHGDTQHEFNIDGVLIKKKPPAPPTRLAPAARAVAADPTTRLVLRMVSRLVAKGVLDGDDMVNIFGGDDVYTEGQHAAAAFGDSAPTSTDGGRWASPPRRDSGGAGEPVDQS